MREGRRLVVSAAGTRFFRPVCVLASALCALAVYAGPVRGEWRSFGVWDGLADNHVHAVFEDGSGNLWFGTQGGVNRYDGVSWTTYTTADGLADDWVPAIIEDGSGNLWFGTGGGVSCHDGVSWTTYTAADGLAPSAVHAIIEDGSGNLWFGTQYGGVSRYDGVSWTRYTTADGLADNGVRAIIEDGSGNLWFGTSDGVSRYDGVSWTTYTTADGLADNGVRAIIEDGSGNLWFGTSDGVSRYDGVSWTTYTTEDGLACNNVWAIVEDSSGDMWFGTMGLGVSRYDGVSWWTYTIADGLASDGVPAIIEDGSGNLWFGTAGGVSCYDGVSWTTYTTEDGLADNRLRAIIEDSSGNLWFGTLGGGVSRYDGVSWTTYTTADGLACNNVWAIVEDSSGDMWFGTMGLGVSRYDGVSWWTYTIADGLVYDGVGAIIEDSSGDLWFGTWGGGVSRYDGASWTTYTTADGLADNRVYAIIEDGSGNLWFGTDDGASRFHGTSWTTYTTEDGLANNTVLAIFEDDSGNLWFGTLGGGVSRYDGLSWRTYTTADGLAHVGVYAIIEDGSGNLWFGTSGGGVSRYDGLSWTTYTTADGLAYDWVPAIIEDGSGNLWFGTLDGLSAHEPDRVAPQTVIWPKPPLLTPSREQDIAFTAAYGESWHIQFSHALDGSSWSEWTQMGSWMGSELSDGGHIFEVRARDAAHNVDSSPAAVTFEVDATPPAAVIASPAFGEAVRDSMAILGTAADPRFLGYAMEMRATGSAEWEAIASSSSPVIEGSLGGWSTALVSDGDYELRLSVMDTLGLMGIGLVRVVVDNEPPWAWETSPVAVSASTGGDVYTTNREVHLYFPPRALARDALVGVVQAEEGSVPDTLAGGAELVLAGYDISWEGVELTKQATLGMTLDERAGARDPDGVLALYVLADGQDWQRLGGTLDSGGASISAAIELEGTYAVFSDSGGPAPGGGLSAVSFTPRVFSPSGSFANTDVAISFTLGRSGPVTAKVYNRAGRLVDELVSRLQMNAGANVLRWDGRDDDGEEVPDGLYLVAVEALGERQVQTLAVVR